MGGVHKLSGYFEQLLEDFCIPRELETVAREDFDTVYEPEHAEDANRAEDGKAIRETYEALFSDVDRSKPCNVLEMKCGLARRVADAMSSEDYIINRTESLRMFLRNANDDLFELYPIGTDLPLWGQMQIFLSKYLEY